MTPIFHQQVLDIIRDAVKQYGSAAALSRATGVSTANLSRWINGKQIPRLNEISPIMAVLGVAPQWPRPEPDKDVCFVNARIAPIGEGIAPPQSEDYIAAPMVGEVGAGLGYIPQDEVKSWFLAYRHHPAVRFRRNLIAVEIGAHSTSMQPTLNPGDIVLVDRDDRDVQHPGHMMLVTDPDGSGMVKRVAIEDKQDGDYRITFYSDNGAKHPPMVYSLLKDYAGDWDKVIAGRVIWAWTDVREK